MIIIDSAKKLVFKDGKQIHLNSVYSYNVLEFLTNSGGMVKTRDDLIKYCWESNKIVIHRNVDYHILKLRKALKDLQQPKDAPHPDQILITIPKIGYKINPLNIKIMSQNGSAGKVPEGYVFIKYAKFASKDVIICKRIQDDEDWIVIQK